MSTPIIWTQFKIVYWWKNWGGVWHDYVRGFQLEVCYVIRVDVRYFSTRYDGKKHGLVPQTYNRSKDCPIECWFVSPSLNISKGYYLHFGRLYSDHRGIWIDIPTKILFGYKPPPITYFGDLPLKLIDPRVVKKVPSIPIWDLPRRQSIC